ncbi:DUF2334 domain-containing protein [[Eubacterium] cellulosolvens]
MYRYHLNRIWDFVTDPRIPHNAIPRLLWEQKLRTIMKSSRLQKGTPLFITLTFDVEREYGAYRIQEDSVGIIQFLRIIQDWIAGISIFIEASLVQGNSESLNILNRKGVEIGLHGYNHELWGPPQWYLSEKPLAPKEKDCLLEASIEVFENSGLSRPKIFRAPNLVSDDITAELLMKKGFSIDSSLPSHRGILPLPLFNREKSFIQIPVTVSPVLSITRKHLFPYLRFRVSNLKTLKEMKDHELLQYVSEIATLQKVKNLPPHLVILSHSWEFSKPRISNREYAYCTPDNIKFLRHIINFLSKSYDVKLLSLSNLADHLFNFDLTKLD